MIVLMMKKRFSVEQIVAVLKQAEVAAAGLFFEVRFRTHFDQAHAFEIVRCDRAPEFIEKTEL